MIIYEIGFPSIIMQSTASFLIFQLNNLLASFSTTATAVLGVYFKLQSFVILPVFGLNNSVVSIVSYNYGAGKIKRLLQTVTGKCICLQHYVHWIYTLSDITC